MRWHLHMRLEHSGFTMDVSEHGTAPIVAIVGPNGSGKTCLMEMICGARTPDSGLISIDGAVFFDAEAGINRPVQDRGVGYVPQGSVLFPHLTVLDNLLLPWTGARAEGVRRAREALAELGCRGLEHAAPASLSGGETQRIALIRAFMRQPRVLVLDEPMAAQDVLARVSFREFFIQRQRQLDIPLFFVTHDVRDVVATGAYVLVLDRGRVVDKGFVNPLMNRPNSEFSRLFFGTNEEKK